MALTLYYQTMRELSMKQEDVAKDRVKLTRCLKKACLYSPQFARHLISMISS